MKDTQLSMVKNTFLVFLPPLKQSLFKFLGRILLFYSAVQFRIPHGSVPVLFLFSLYILSIGNFIPAQGFNLYLLADNSNVMSHTYTFSELPSPYFYFGVSQALKFNTSKMKSQSHLTRSSSNFPYLNYCNHNHQEVFPCQ